MQQLDLTEGEHRRDLGIEKVTSHNGNWLATARLTAEGIARRHGKVSSDELREVLGDHQPDHPNAYGSVFRDKRFQAIGFKKSENPSRHAGMIRVYRLADG